MRDLIEGIRIYLGATKGRHRIQLSSGTLPAARSSEYEHEAIIPAAPWRRPSSRESSILTIREAPNDLGSAITVVPLPRLLLRPFEPLRSAAANSRSREQINAMLDGHKFQPELCAVIRYVGEQFRRRPENGQGENLAGGIFSKPPRQWTVTTDPGTDRLVGLHVDNWSQYPIDRRDQAPNRIAFNLGCGDRFFLFVNIPVGVMYSVVKDLIRPLDHTTGVGRVFMTLFPWYPVVRLRIRPGEAYIAPTENLVHDGSTAETATADITLSLRGRFALCEKDKPVRRGR